MYNYPKFKLILKNLIPTITERTKAAANWRIPALRPYHGAFCNKIIIWNIRFKMMAILEKHRRYAKQGRPTLNFHSRHCFQGPFWNSILDTLIVHVTSILNFECWIDHHNRRVLLVTCEIHFLELQGSQVNYQELCSLCHDKHQLM